MLKEYRLIIFQSKIWPVKKIWIPETKRTEERNQARVDAYLEVGTGWTWQARAPRNSWVPRIHREGRRPLRPPLRQWLFPGRQPRTASNTVPPPAYGDDDGRPCRPGGDASPLCTARNYTNSGRSSGGRRTRPDPRPPWPRKRSLPPSRSSWSRLRPNCTTCNRKWSRPLPSRP